MISIQLLSNVWLFATPWSTECQASLTSTNFQSLFTHVYRVSDAIQSSYPLWSPSPPTSILPSIRVFSNESIFYIRWPKYWSFSISPSNEYSGLISFRIDLFDLLAVQGTLKRLLQHHSSKASILCIQLSLWSNSHIQTVHDYWKSHSFLISL